MLYSLTMQSFSYAEKIARWAAFLPFLFVPFFFVPVSWVEVSQAKMFFVVITICVGFLAWVVTSLKNAEFSIAKSTLLIAALFVPMAYLVSAIASGPTWSALVGEGGPQESVVSLAIWYSALFLVASVLGAEVNRVGISLRLFLAGALVVIIIQTVHLFIPTSTFGGVLQVPTASVVGSWHDLAIFLALTLFLSLALSPSSLFAGMWRYLATGVAAGSFLLLLVINYSDVWIALGVAGLLYAYFRSQTPPFSARFFGHGRFLLWLAFSGIAFSMYFVGTPIQNTLPQPLRVAQVEVRPSWQGTFMIGRGVFAEPTRIFFGSGPNTFPQQWGLYKPLSVNETQFWNTDFYYGVGFIPTSLVTTGLIGLFAWLAVCAALGSRLVRLFKDAASATVSRASLVISTLFFTIYHIFYVPGPALSFLTFILFGALIAEEVSSGILPRVSASLSWDHWKGKGVSIALCVAGLVLLFGGIQSARALASDMLVNRAVHRYASTQNIGEAQRSVSLALLVLPGSDRAHRAGVELGLLQLAALAARSDGSEEAQAELQGTLNAVIQHGLAAIQIEDRNYQNWLTLARLYSELAGARVSGAEQAARDAYMEASAVNPTNPLPYLGEAQLDLLHGDDARARENLEKAIGIKSDLAAAHFLLSQIDARANDLPKALEHASNVVQLASQDALGWYNHGTILYATGDYTRAATSLERAVELESDYANATFLLGLTYYRLDRQEEALKALRAVAALNPDDSDLKQTIRRIESGKNPFVTPGR